MLCHLYNDEGKKCQPIIVYPDYIAFKNEGKIQPISIFGVYCQQTCFIKMFSSRWKKMIPDRNTNHTKEESVKNDRNVDKYKIYFSHLKVLNYNCSK